MLGTRSGQKRTLNSRHDRIIKRIVIGGEASNAFKATCIFNQATKMNVSAHSVRKSLRRSGLESRVKRKKPLLKAIHVQRGLYFSQKYQNLEGKRLEASNFFGWIEIQAFSVWWKRVMLFRSKTTFSLKNQAYSQIWRWICLCILLCEFQGGRIPL